MVEVLNRDSLNNLLLPGATMILLTGPEQRQKHARQSLPMILARRVVMAKVPPQAKERVKKPFQGAIMQEKKCNLTHRCRTI
jgi:hypothetical protein